MFKLSNFIKFVFPIAIPIGFESIVGNSVGTLVWTILEGISFVEFRLATIFELFKLFELFGVLTCSAFVVFAIVTFFCGHSVPQVIHFTPSSL